MQDDTQMQQLIAQDLGIADLSSDEQQEIIAQFGALALKAATVAVAEALAEDKRARFAELAQGGDASALQAFLSAELPSHEEIAKAAVATEVAKFKQFQAGAAAA